MFFFSFLFSIKTLTSLLLIIFNIFPNIDKLRNILFSVSNEVWHMKKNSLLIMIYMGKIKENRERKYTIIAYSVHFGLLWSYSIHFSLLCSYSVHFGPNWSYTVNTSSIWSTMVLFGPPGILFGLIHSTLV